MAEAEVLQELARRYVWWKTPREALAAPSRLVAQVMDIGDYADVQRLIATLGEDPLRQALLRAEAGQFSERSWTYWHYRLDLAEAGHVPPMSQRPVE
jgi:hypothetical protein